ncbi:MAG: hypothetical protein AAF593_11045 [Planctomycetota bacterium]
MGEEKRNWVDEKSFDKLEKLEEGQNRLSQELMNYKRNWIWIGVVVTAAITGLGFAGYGEVMARVKTAITDQVPKEVNYVVNETVAKQALDRITKMATEAESNYETITEAAKGGWTEVTEDPFSLSHEYLLVWDSEEGIQNLFAIRVLKDYLYFGYNHDLHILVDEDANEEPGKERVMNARLQGADVDEPLEGTFKVYSRSKAVPQPFSP